MKRWGLLSCVAAAAVAAGCSGGDEGATGGAGNPGDGGSDSSSTDAGADHSLPVQDGGHPDGDHADAMPDGSRSDADTGDAQPDGGRSDADTSDAIADGSSSDTGTSLPPGKHVPNFGDGAQLLYATDYTNRDERSVAGGAFWLQYQNSSKAQVWNPTYLAPVEAPWDSSKKAVRSIIHKGDDWEGNGYPRSELMLSIVPQLDGGGRYFISFGFMFPSDAEAYIDGQDSEMLAVLQLHHPENTGSPPLAFS